MNVLIVEDEKLTALEIKKMISEIAPDYNVLDIKSSIEETVDFFKQPHPEIGLIFMDIQLSDGTCFEIFDQVDINCPVIFITAYNEYALKAFKLNSIDYLLKPLKKEELLSSITKFKRLFVKPALNSSHYKTLMASLSQFMGSNFISRILVNKRDYIIPLNVSDIAFFYSEFKVVKVFSLENQIYTIDKNLEQLEDILSPECFFRVNRQFIMSIHAIKKVKKHFNRRLYIIPFIDTKLEIIVSTRKANLFLEWLNNVEHCQRSGI